MSYQPVIDYSYLAEIKLVNAPAAGQKVPFLDIPQLRTGTQKIKTIGISCYTRTQLTVTPNSNVTVALVTGMVLTLAIGSEEEIYLIPCIDLVSANNAGLIRLLREKEINLPKSYITILDAAGLAVNESVLFNFIYRKV